MKKESLTVLEPGSDRGDVSRSGIVMIATTIATLTVWAPIAIATELTRTSHGMVTSAHPLATQAGLKILQQGGNAIDNYLIFQIKTCQYQKDDNIVRPWI